MHDKANITVQGLWLGERFSTMERLALTSFLANGHSFELYVYHRVEGTPTGVILKDANEIWPESKAFRYGESGSYAVFSDMFRYKLLFERGGWWADTDVVCLKPFDFEFDYVFATETDSRGREFVNNGILKAPSGCELLERALRFCEKENIRQLPWGATGPNLLHRLIYGSTLSQYCQDPNTFCPISPIRWMLSVLPFSAGYIKPNTHAVHLWNEMWRRFPLDKDAEYAPSSLYEQLKNKYLCATFAQLSLDGSK